MGKGKKGGAINKVSVVVSSHHRSFGVRSLPGHGRSSQSWGLFGQVMDRLSRRGTAKLCAFLSACSSHGQVLKSRLSARLSEAFQGFTAHPQCDGQGEQTTERLTKEYHLRPSRSSFKTYQFLRASSTMPAVRTLSGFAPKPSSRALMGMISISPLRHSNHHSRGLVASTFRRHSHARTLHGASKRSTISTNGLGSGKASGQL